MSEQIMAIYGQIYSNNPDSPYVVDVPDIYDSDRGQTLNLTLTEKVDKEDGKGLSTNDYTNAEKTKLAGIAANAEVNQYAFTKVKVGNTTLQATSKTDTLILKQAGRAGLTANTADNSVTISASGEGGSAGTLNTNNASPQTVSSSESLAGTVSLHKISKTGSYEDLNDKPTVLEDKEYEEGANTGMGKKTLSMNEAGGMNLLTQSMMTDSNTIYVVPNDYVIGTATTVDLTRDYISMTVGGINYFAKATSLFPGETITVTTPGAYLFTSPNGGTTWVTAPNNTYTASTNEIVRVGAVAYSSTTSAEYVKTGGSIIIPSGCILEFDGGSIAGGTLVGNNTSIKAGLVKIFDPAITIEGTWNVTEAYPEWFGAGLGNIVGYNDVGVALTDDTVAIQAAVTAFDYVKLSKLYTISTVVVPQFHTVENSTTYVLDGDGYKLMMKSVLTGGLIEVNSTYKYYVDSVNNRLVKPNAISNYTATVSLSGPSMEIDASTNATPTSATIRTITYYYTEVTVPSGKILKVTDLHDDYGYLFQNEGTGGTANWVMNKDGSFTGKSGGTTVRIAKRQDYWYDGALTYDIVTSHTAISGDYTDYNTFIKNRTSAITIGEESSNSRRVIVSGVKITTGNIYDANHNEIAGGARDTYIAAGIKTEAENINTKWNSFMMFTDVDIYGLFYGIVGNLRACRFNITMEQCYDNIDIYGDLNIFDLNGQTGVVLNLNPNDTQNPIRPYDYFMYINGTSNVINDGIYDIGSKPRNHQYMIKQSSYNVINSRALLNYTNVIANKTNGDFMAGTKYSWIGTHKHDYTLKGLKYTATLENSTYSGTIDTQNLFDPRIWIDFVPTGTYDSTSKTYSDTMRLTISIDDIYEPYGVAAFAQSNGYNFKTMKVYYGQSNGEDTLVGTITRSSTPYLDWNPDYNITRNGTPKTLKLVFESNQEVRWFGLRVYGKTEQPLNHGTIRPTKELSIGQQFFDTSLSPARPVFWNGEGWSDLISVVDLPTAQYIDYFAPDQGSDYKSVDIPYKGVNVKCYTDGNFVCTGTCTSAGGRTTKLCNVFTLPAGTYTLTRDVLRGSIDDMYIYLMTTHGTSRDDDDDAVTDFNVGRKTLTLTEPTPCYIGINFANAVTYDTTIKLRIATMATSNLDSVIGDILFRLAKLEGN